MEQQQGSAFITTLKGVCYLTLKCNGRNFHISRIRNYTLDAEKKRRMHRLYPEVIFDWKKITRQLAEKREVCRGYRSQRRSASAAHRREPSYAVYDPATRTLYANGDGVGAIAFLDAILSMERQTNSPAPLPSRRKAEQREQIALATFGHCRHLPVCPPPSR